MIAIAAVDENYAIGYKNRLLARIPADMKRYKELTIGNITVMGRKTYSSLPSRPLSDRVNVVLTESPERITEKSPDLITVTSIDELLKTIQGFEETGKKVFICGGGMIYKRLLPYCEQALITKIKAQFEADSWFPSLEKLSEWELVSESEEIETNGFKIKFLDYVNRKLI